MFCKRRSDITERPEETTHYTRCLSRSISEDLTYLSDPKKLLKRFKPIEHSSDINSLTYAVSQFTRTSEKKQQNSTNISKTTFQKLANEKLSFSSINCHNPNRNNSLHTTCALFCKRRSDITERPEETTHYTRCLSRSISEDLTYLSDPKKLLKRFKPIEHSSDINSLTYAVSQFTRTSAKKNRTVLIYQKPHVKN